MSWAIQTQEGAPSDDPGLEQANLLQRTVVDCERVLAAAPTFGGSTLVSHRRTASWACRPSGRHVVNTVAALQVLGRHRERFDADASDIYDGLSLERIVGKFASWRRTSRESPDGSPRGRSIRGARTSPPWFCWRLRPSSDPNPVAAAFKDDKDDYRDELKKLVDWVARWSVEDMGDHDHPFFAVTALDAIDAFVKLSPFARVAVGRQRDAAIRRLEKEFYRQFSFVAAGMHQHVDAANLTLSFCAVAERGTGLTPARTTK